MEARRFSQVFDRLCLTAGRLARVKVDLGLLVVGHRASKAMCDGGTRRVSPSRRPFPEPHSPRIRLMQGRGSYAADLTDKRGYSLAVAIALMGIAMILTMAPAAQADPFPECPPAGRLHAGRLQHDGVSCAKARHLILGFIDGSQAHGPHFMVDGFSCHNVAEGTGPGIICRRGSRRARFLGYPDFPGPA